MNRGVRFSLLLALMIFVDALLLRILTTTTETGAVVDRLMSLAAGLAIALLANRVLPVATNPRKQPGFWPLAAISLVLSYGIFAALASRAPQVQPLVHLGFAWACALTFGGLGLYRIRRWRN